MLHRHLDHDWWGLLCAFVLFSVVFLVVSACNQLNLSSRESRCRIIFSDVLADPEAVGGISIISGTLRDEMCIYGTLAEIDISFLDVDISAQRFDITVNSVGGPVDVWLALAEKLEGSVASLTVDLACMSSCANYILPIADSVVVRRNSLVVWHGADHVDAKLRARTDALYQRHSISTAVLQDTGRKPSHEVLQNLRANNPSAVQIIGYAPTPRFLRECYNFQNLKTYSHPGTTQELNAILIKRSRTSVVVMNPESQC